MPDRGVARQQVRFGIQDSGLEFAIRQQGHTVWVTLSGILDRPQLARLVRRVTPLLEKRGRQVILDGRQLHHVDYRVVRPLIDWNRRLRAFDHRLLLSHWSDYLKAILCMEDWNRELNPGPLPTSAWRLLSKPRPGQAL